jgi:hypothetical protein
MSAGFKIAGEVFWGTNGAVEEYVAAIADEATARFGPDDGIAGFFRDERDCFSSGRVVFLDGMLGAPESRARFLTVLDAATERLQRAGTFTEYGRDWVESTIGRLRAKVAGGSSNSEKGSPE